MGAGYSHRPDAPPEWERGVLGIRPRARTESDVAVCVREKVFMYTDKTCSKRPTCPMMVSCLALVPEHANKQDLGDCEEHPRHTTPAEFGVEASAKAKLGERL